MTSPPDPGHDSLVGRDLKHYRVEDVLGRGGMGVVYRARDTRLDRPVALKVLSDALVHDALFKRRFLQEARAASAVNHPAIAQIYDVDDVEGVTFIAMELVEGRTVADLVMDRSPDLLRTLDIVIQAARGLDKAHEVGIVHRDIKSQNIMVTRDGHVKILDFGLAKLLDTTDSTDGREALTRMETIAQTRMGLVVGTVAYMSPEQARGRPVDHRSDIFSLGIVLHELVTGERPFSGDTALDTMHAIAFGDSRPIAELRSDVPVSLQRVVSRCLTKSPEERYASARELVADLTDVRREVESGIFRDPPLAERLRERVRALKEQPPSSWFIALAAAALAAVIVVLIVGRDIPFGEIIVFAILGLFIYRRFRNRRIRLIGRFAGKVKKMPEVRLIVRDVNRIVVHVDSASASTYARINEQIDKVNGKLFVGEPFTVSIKEDRDPEERRTLLEGPGVIYVRDDVTDAAG
jgi:predicted Ser/Thr protein kinase